MHLRVNEVIIIEEQFLPINEIIVIDNIQYLNVDEIEMIRHFLFHLFVFFYTLMMVILCCNIKNSKNKIIKGKVVEYKNLKTIDENI